METLAVQMTHGCGEDKFAVVDKDTGSPSVKSAQSKGCLFSVEMLSDRAEPE